MRPALAALLLLSLTASARADEAEQCRASTVHMITLPVYSHRANSSTFRYRYQLIPARDPSAPQDAPMVIYIPGGPGGASIVDFENTTNPALKAGIGALGYSPKLQWVFTDPRDVGCNTLKPGTFPDDSLSTDELASDVLGLIRALKPKSYILYGHSYGSLLATVIASRATHGEAPPPLAVVLSGVLGEGKTDGSNSILTGLREQWEKIRNDLPAPALEEVEKPAPFGEDPSEFSDLISRYLYRGAHLHDGVFSAPLNDILSAMPDDSPASVAATKSKLDALPLVIGSFDFNEQLFSKIDCDEFSNTDPLEMTWTDGDFSLVPGRDACTGRAQTHLFDSARWQIEAPIYYLSGTNDPAAPYNGAVYHFEHQSFPRRYFMKVPGGGHDMLGQIFGDCLDRVWSAITANDGSLAATLQSCHAPIELQTP